MSGQHTSTTTGIDIALEQVISRAGDQLSRRALLRGLGRGALAAAAAGVALPASLAMTEQVSAAHRRDPGEAGVELMRAWAWGEFVSQLELIPSGWELYVPQVVAAFQYPRDWTVSEYHEPYEFATGVSPSSVWIVAPDESAGVLIVTMVDEAVPAPAEVGWEQLKLAAGKGKLTPMVEDELPDVLNAKLGFVAGRVGELVGTVLTQVGATPELGGSMVSFILSIAHEDDFDELAEEVFVPLALSMVGAGGGSSEEEEEEEEDE